MRSSDTDDQYRIDIWTVSDLTQHIKQILQEDESLRDVELTGEVSNFTRAASGHLYFSLKDSKATIRCVMWRQMAGTLSALPQDGDSILARGYVDVYELNGNYQFYVSSIQPLGQGALFQRFLLLKDKLEREGLFDPAQKKSLPEYPKVIGIVTSPTGAALQDILNTIRRRYPSGSVILSPCPVQGVDAPAEIIRAITALDQDGKVDVIILARGGGSIEDLWAFNDENLARAIHRCQTPVISGIGHETDFTIADFVSDLRAPTPTAAAELATPSQIEMVEQLKFMDGELERIIAGRIKSSRSDLENLRLRVQARSPDYRIFSEKQRLDELEARLSTSLRSRIMLIKASLEVYHQKFNGFDPESILNRGYAIVTHQTGTLIRSVGQVTAGEMLNIKVSDGMIVTQAQDQIKDRS